MVWMIIMNNLRDSSFCWLKTSIKCLNRTHGNNSLMQGHIRKSKIGYSDHYHKGKYCSSRILANWHRSYILVKSKKTAALASNRVYIALLSLPCYIKHRRFSISTRHSYFLWILLPNCIKNEAYQNRHVRPYIHMNLFKLS